MNKLLDAKAVSSALGVCSVTLWRHCKAGKFPAPIMIGRLPRWSSDCVERFLAAASAKANHSPSTAVPQVDMPINDEVDDLAARLARYR